MELVNSQEERERLLAALAAVGVESVELTGEPFGPEHHEPLLPESPADPGLHHRVERTVSAGYRDTRTGEVLGDPKVVVFVDEACGQGLLTGADQDQPSNGASS